jgi:SAM-dependent methyltransferase
MDASSGAAVAALDIQEGEHVLDLCCAPGAKLCMMAERVGPAGSVTGVDVSLARLCTCRRSMVEKYGIRNARLFLADAQHFNVPPPQTGHRQDEMALAPRSRKRRQGQSGPAAALGLAPDATTGDEQARLLCVSETFACAASAHTLYDKVRESLFARWWVGRGKTERYRERRLLLTPLWSTDGFCEIHGMESLRSTKLKRARARAGAGGRRMHTRRLAQGL